MTRLPILFSPDSPARKQESRTPVPGGCLSARQPGQRTWDGLWTPLARLGEAGLTRPSPPFRGEREGPGAKRWEGEVGLAAASGIPHLTPTLSAPGAERENSRVDVTPS